MKRILSLFLCLICISALCISTFADGHLNEMEVEATIGEGAGTYKLTIGELGTDKDVNNSKMANILKQYRVIIAILTGVGALTMLLMFLLNFAKLGQSGGNPQMRQSAIIGLLFTGGATALLGSVMTFFVFFYNFIPG